MPYTHQQQPTFQCKFILMDGTQHDWTVEADTSQAAEELVFDYCIATDVVPMRISTQRVELH